MPHGALAVVGHIGPSTAGNRMSAPHALAALAALGQPTRLEIFRLLMRAPSPYGPAAGSIADTIIGCPHNTLSSHLSILARSGWFAARGTARSIIYRADIEGIRTLGRPFSCRLLRGHPSSAIWKTAIRNATQRPCPMGKVRKPEEMSMGKDTGGSRTTSCSSAPGIRRARSWRRPFSIATVEGTSEHFRQEATRKAEVHPYALDLLRKLNYDVSGFRSKSWKEFSGPDAPEARFRLHGLRQRGARSLSVLAGSADDGALGRARSRRCHRYRGGSAVRLR